MLTTRRSQATSRSSLAYLLLAACSTASMQAPDSGVAPDLTPAPDAGPGCKSGADVYAAPQGSGSACTCAAPCSLDGARDRARELAAQKDLGRDLVIELAGGTYLRSAPFVLGVADSGANGHAVIYRAAASATPVLSGGLPVTGFAPDRGGVQVASVPAGTRGRQLYVNGRRATRARGGDAPSGYTLQSGGFTLGDPAIASWPDRLKLEVVGLKQWKSFRCGISDVSTAAGLVLLQPCWGYSQAQASHNFDSVAWLENARELLDQPGEFYLDEDAGRLYYWPLADEDLTSAEVILPTAESLLRAAGTPAAPVHDITFSGLTFAYATWNGPSSSDGYAALQAGITKRGGVIQKPPAHVTLHATERVQLTGCRFTHLGAAGLAIEAGARNNTVERCRFEDLSGSAILVGDVTHVEDHHPSDPALIVRDNAVRGCYVTRTSAEYFDMAALFAGYTTRTTFEGNEIFDVPYTGISLGWGWGSVDPGGAGGYTTPSTAQGNLVRNNLISHHMRRLHDGGAIYVLGAQPGSTMQGNISADQGYPYGNFYLDNGSQGWTVAGNLALLPAKEAGTGVERTYWLYVQVYPPLATYNTVGLNYTNDALLFTPMPIDPSNTLTTPQSDAMAPAGLVAGAGTPLRSPNIAVGKATTASSVYDPTHPAAAANNGNSYDGWSPSVSDPAASWQVDLGATYAVDAIEVVSRWGYDQPASRRNYRVLAGIDATLKDGQVIGQVGATELPHRAIYSRTLETPVRARYVRVEKTQPEYFFLAEVRVHGQPAP